MLFRKRKEIASDPAGESAGVPAVQAEPGIPSSLVAVIAAAIAAESGLAPGAFRIASVSPTGCDSGFNTPVWGRVERLYRA
jgi:hypothetical protein